MDECEKSDTKGLYDQATNCLIHFYKRFQIRSDITRSQVDLIKFCWDEYLDCGQKGEGSTS